MKDIEEQNYSVATEDRSFSYIYRNETDISVAENKTSEKITVSGGKVYCFFKRTFDIFASGLFLILFGWFILLLMLIKYLEDAGAKTYKLDIKPATQKSKKKYCYLARDGKVWEVRVIADKSAGKDNTVHGPIYTSIRVGKNKKLFKFHKIRSMCKGAEAMKAQLIEYGINEVDGPIFKLKYDPRITRFGRFLRKTSLDELPQIWDIFIGNLSIIGPRSPIPEEVEKYNEYQMHRLDVKGGLLCFWQTKKGRHSVSFDEWVDLDIKYIQTRSIWVDLKIFCKGIWMLITDRSGE